MPDESDRLGQGLEQAGVWIAVALAAVGILLRVLFLDADPAYPLWWGYLADEGRWTEQARKVALYGAPGFDGWYSAVHLVLAPLYQGAVWIAFTVGGVGSTSARLVSAVGGILLVLAAVRYLRPRTSSTGLVVAVMVLCLQPDLVLLSRVAIPEIPSLLFVFLSFACLVSGPVSIRRTVGAGLLVAVAVGFKATSALVIPFLAVVPLVRRGVNDPFPIRPVAVYLGAALLPILALGGVLVVGSGAAEPTSWGGPIREIPGFLRAGSLFGAASILWLDETSVPINALLLAAWSVGGALLIGARSRPSDSTRVLYVASAVWAGGWIALSLALGYFPVRYRLHALVPLALHLAAGITLLQRVGLERLIQAVRESTGLRRAIAAAWLLFPLALVVAPALPGLPVAADGESWRLRTLVGSVAGVAVVLALPLLARWRFAGTIAAFWAAPWVIGALWLATLEAGLVAGPYWGPPGARGMERWIPVLAGGGLVALLALRLSQPIVVRACWIAAAGVVAAVWVVQSSDRLVHRTYTLAEAAAGMERTLRAELPPGDSALVGTRRLGGLFLGTRLPYTENLDVRLPPAVVSIGPVEEAIEPAYRLIERYRVNLAGAEAALGTEPEILVYLRRVDEVASSAEPPCGSPPCPAPAPDSADAAAARPGPLRR